MITAPPHDARQIEAQCEGDQTTRVTFSWLVSAASGSSSTAVVRTAIEPGHRLGTHRDSVEEVILILEGQAEVSLGDEVAHLSAGELAVVPAMVPHGMRKRRNRDGAFRRLLSQRHGRQHLRSTPPTWQPHGGGNTELDGRTGGRMRFMFVWVRGCVSFTTVERSSSCRRSAGTTISI